MRFAIPLLVLALTVAPALAQDVARHEIQTAVVAAIAANPGAAEVIVADAVGRHPRFREDIVTAAVDAFPAFASRLRAAAGAPAEWIEPEPQQIAQLPPVVTPAPLAPAPPRPARAGALTAELSLGGALATGNAEARQLSAEGRWRVLRRPWTASLEVLFDYAHADGETGEQRLVVSPELRRDLGPRLFALANVRYEDDRFSGYEWELTEAVALGYRLVDEPGLELVVEAGPALRQAEIERTGATKKDVAARGRAGLAWQVSPTIRLTDDLLVVAGGERITTDNTAAVTSKVNDRLGLRLSLNLRHDSDPPIGAEELDTLTKAAVVYEYP